MKINNLLLALVLLVCNFLFSQNKQKQIEGFQLKTNAEITFSNNLSTIKFIKFPVGNPLELAGNSLQEKAINFLEIYKEIYNIDFQKNSFNTDKVITDNYGLKHIVVNQFYDNVPVFDGKLIFHFNSSNNLTSVNGNFISNIKLNAAPNLTQSEANQIALQEIEKQNINYSGDNLFVNKTNLYVFEKGLIQDLLLSKHLVYEVEVRNNLDVREFVFIDAHTGKKVEQFTGIAHALNRILYEGNTATITWVEGDAFPGTLDIWQRNEVEATAHMYNFFNNAFSYESYNGSGITMRIINNASVPNASWNGVTANFSNGFATDDVIAHEWGHAYTEYTNGLIYAWQSGAINEAYSDIWGETIDLLNAYEDAGEDLSLRTGCSSSDRWRMGEDTGVGAIRDMWDPTCNGHPGKVTDTEYSCSTADSGGVHSNSGIPNHTYALLVDGGIYNGQTINALGFIKTAHIFWRAQSQYLTATSNFNDLADALEASANDLIGFNLEGLSTTTTAAGLSGEIISNLDAATVAQAILAVEMRTNPTACGFTAILSETATLCSAATTNPIFMEDWESGIGSWNVTQLPTNPGTWDSRDWSLVSSLPQSRTGSAMFGIDPINGNCNSDLENGIIRLESPVIVIPNYGTGNFEMAFNHNVSTETNWDGGNIKYKIGNGSWEVIPASAFITNAYNGVLNGGGNDNPMASEEAFTGSDGGSVSGSWGTSVINLSNIGVLQNSTVQFRWELGTDGCNGRLGWYIDEIMIYNCDFTLAAPEFDDISNNVLIYPNPSNGNFTLEKLYDIDLQKAEVYDINGRFIKTIDLSLMNIQQEINLNEVVSGIYFMALTSNKSKEVIKLIKK